MPRRCRSAGFEDERATERARQHRGKTSMRVVCADVCSSGRSGSLEYQRAVQLQGANYRDHPRQGLPVEKLHREDKRSAAVSRRSTSHEADDWLVRRLHQQGTEARAVRAKEVHCCAGTTENQAAISSIAGERSVGARREPHVCRFGGQGHPPSINGRVHAGFAAQKARPACG